MSQTTPADRHTRGLEYILCQLRRLLFALWLIEVTPPLHEESRRAHNQAFHHLRTAKCLNSIELSRCILVSAQRYR